MSIAYGRLTSFPPLPPPFTLWRTHRPPLYPIPIPIGAVCGCARWCGGGGGEESSSISPLLRNSGAPSALKQIVHKSSYLYSLFHSVIYNSVCKYIEQNKMCLPGVGGWRARTGGREWGSVPRSPCWSGRSPPWSRCPSRGRGTLTQTKRSSHLPNKK